MEATTKDAPVGASEGGVAQRVAYRVDGAVDVAQPVTYSNRYKNIHLRVST